tara:strand:- start:1464 stop:1907 length:444 start_codon:yes stop_codon:yes gene_type:complete
MAIDLSNYDIKFYQGDTFKLDFSYTTSADVGINLSNYTANMQIRRSAFSSTLLAELNETYPAGSFGRGSAGSDFSAGSGVTGGTGGLVLNYSGTTGAIHIEIDSTTSSNIPAGKHVYDLQLVNDSDGVHDTILRGRMTVVESTTKLS